MERESLLCILIVLLGGAAFQAFASWPASGATSAVAAEAERRGWLALWLPVVPALAVAAWLCGWALCEPDPVPDRLGRWGLVAACAPFAWVFARAAGRAVWSLLRGADERTVSTVGLIRPQILFPPLLAKRLDDGALRAALLHERAHAEHRDPLRIWLAQLVTDLQWPWPAARERLERWLVALEHARDDEARAAGADGADLAAAVLAAVRFHGGAASSGSALAGAVGLTHVLSVSEPELLRRRVARLLRPLPNAAEQGHCGASLPRRAGLLLISVLFASLMLGALVGERVIHGLLALT